jgi:hypothetical protein
MRRPARVARRDRSGFRFRGNKTGNTLRNFHDHGPGHGGAGTTRTKRAHADPARRRGTGTPSGGPGFGQPAAWRGAGCSMARFPLTAPGWSALEVRPKRAQSPALAPMTRRETGRAVPVVTGAGGWPGWCLGAGRRRCPPWCGLWEAVFVGGGPAAHRAALGAVPRAGRPVLSRSCALASARAGSRRGPAAPCRLLRRVTASRPGRRLASLPRPGRLPLF